jgi:two-component system, LytTR family, sensor kinase
LSVNRYHKKGVIGFHALFWIAYVAINTIMQWSQVSSANFFISEQITKYGCAILVFYSFLYLLRNNFGNYNYLIKLLFLVAIIVGYYILKYTINYKVLPVVSSYPQLTFEFPGFALPGVWWIGHYMLYAWGYWYYNKSLMVQAQNFELLTQKINLQHNFLKSQINPHFLYNTLGFLYTKTKKADAGAARGIYLLTEIMSYALEGDTKNNMAPLAEEVAHLENYIELNRLRFDGALQLHFEKTGSCDGIDIPHYTLITFVENAFKHGVVNNPAHPVRIALTCTPKEMIFTVENKKDLAESEPNSSGGVGLKNIQERLAVAYGNKHEVCVSQDEQMFRVKLTVWFMENKGIFA